MKFLKHFKLSELDDDELMEKVMNGENHAFEILFDRHGGRVLGYSQRLLGEREKAEDLAQEVWMRVIRYAQNYQKKGQFIAWVYTITRNLALNSLRKNKDWDVLEETNTPAEETPLEEVLSEKSDLQKLKEKIDSLPSSQRAVLVLHTAEELSYEEIASELNTTVSSVKSLLFRARQNLQKSLSKSESA